jgi:hypothetical protein
MYDHFCQVHQNPTVYSHGNGLTHNSTRMRSIHMHVGGVSLGYYPMSTRTYMIEACTACPNDTDRRAARGQLTCSRRMSERALGSRVFVQVPGTPPIESRLTRSDDCQVQRLRAR